MKLIFCPDHKIPMQLRDDGQLMDSSTGEVKKYWYSCPHYPARCEYSIGAHQNTQEPFGFPADRATRALRVKLHQLIDPLWKHRGKKYRDRVYEDLARKMGLRREECHVAMFTKEDCKRAIAILVK